MMPTARLTKRVIDGIAPTDKSVIVYDTDLKGFGLRVTPTGAKSFVVEYRPGGGRNAPTRRMTLGPLGTVTPDEARRRARDILARVRLGEDPAGERQKRRETPTFAEVVERFLEDEAGRLKPRTLANYKSAFALHVVPKLGTTKITDVTHADVARLHRVIGKTRPITANRTVEAIGSLYRYAAGEGYVERGSVPPTHGIKAYRETGRERFLSTDELARLGAALVEAETVGVPWEVDEDRPTAKHVPKGERRTKVDPFAAAAIRLLLFTGARLREVLRARWEHFDPERGLLLIPDSKTGRKTLVLNAPALAILADLPRLGELIIPGADPDRPRADLKRPWAAVTARAGLHGLRIHDLRHSFASVGAGAGMGLPIVGKLLGHASPATTQRYAHLDADPLRAASNRIGGAIAAAMGGAPPAEVVPIRKASS